MCYSAGGVDENNATIGLLEEADFISCIFLPDKLFKMKLFSNSETILKHKFEPNYINFNWISDFKNCIFEMLYNEYRKIWLGGMLFEELF